jgi:outer membrane receptor protein involved in Fe transport
MKKIILILFVAVSSTAMAQKFSIKGQLLDSLNNPMPSATILILNPKDSSLVNFGVGDAQGNFEIRNIARSEHLFKITFLGYRSYWQKITPPETGAIVELGKINMEAASSQLEAIEIAADRAPVTVKRDTIEFNAASFKTKQNAVVEDLLKKLPGVEVDNDGNITAQGEQVRNVTVDGKKFFGSDPKLATKNLPADAIDKVQVFDKKSDQTAFSGIDDGQREKTINLELKEEKRNGAFGTLMGGAGTDDRFQGRVNLNRFSKGNQLSFLGMGNNVNDQGFSMDEYMNFTGGSQRMMGGGGAVRMEFGGDNSNGVPLNFGNRANGIMTNYAGGLNLNNQFSKKTELNGSYFYNYLDHDKDQSTFRQNFLPDNQSFTFNENSRQQNSNANHRMNLTLDHKLDSLNSLKLTTNVTYNETDSEVISTSENLNPDQSVQSESSRLSLSSGINQSLSSTLLWRHKFAKKGRTFSTNLLFNASQNDREGLLDAVNDFYGNNSRQVINKQSNEQSTDYQSYGGTLSYTEPLGKRKYLEANYSFRQNLNQVDRLVYDISSDQPELLSDLSSQYSSDYQYHRGGLNFRMNKSKYNLLIGGSVQRTYLQGFLKIQDVEIERSYQNLLPAVRFNYDFSTTKHLRFDYETSVQEPTIQQLQPVVDNSDPLNLYVGNPQLRPAYAQSWRLNFTTFDPTSFVSFFTFVDVDYTTNAITNAQQVSADFVRTTIPVNVDNNMSVRGNATVGFPIPKLKSRISVGGNYRNQKSINLLNEEASTINQQTAGGEIRYNFTYKEIFDLSLSADIDHQLTNYEFNQPDQAFINSTYTAESNLTFLKNYQLSSNFEYLEYENENSNYKQTIPLLNLSVSRFILKNKTGEIKLAVNNLLDKALGVNQTASINYLERQVTNSLGRYFMLSFTYSLNKQLNPMGMRRSGGARMMRIMR